MIWCWLIGHKYIKNAYGPFSDWNQPLESNNCWRCGKLKEA